MCKFFKNKYLLILIVIFALFYLFIFYNNTASISPYPYGKNFAFTITSDPDRSSLHENKVVFNFLDGIGIRTTIAVWVKEAKRTNGIPDNLMPPGSSYRDGDSCANPDYLKYMQELNARGFEIALHTVSSGNDYRNDTLEGYEIFEQMFGYYPSINIMHSSNLENVYWGNKTVNNKFVRLIIELFSERANFPFSGEDPDSVYFWGDILKDKTKYVRLWGTKDINTLKFNPSMPYHDPQKPFVNYWFSFSDGWTVEVFNKLISTKNILRLAKQRGACIVYTHFHSGFVKNGEIDPIFKENMTNLSKFNDGWFVPATELLYSLLMMKNVFLKNNLNTILIINRNDVDVNGVTLLIKPGSLLYDAFGNKIKPNEEGEIIIHKLKKGETLMFSKNKKHYFSLNEYPALFERINLFIQRSIVYLSHNS